MIKGRGWILFVCKHACRLWNQNGFLSKVVRTHTLLLLSDLVFSLSPQLLNAMQKFGANLDDYLHLLLPPVVKLFDSNDIPITVRR